MKKIITLLIAILFSFSSCELVFAQADSTNMFPTAPSIPGLQQTWSYSAYREQQTIACPVNYTGTINQSRLIEIFPYGTQVGAWQNDSSNCVYVPPPPPPPPPPPAPTCKYDAANYIHRVLPPFWNTPDYYYVWDSSIDIAKNGAHYAQSLNWGNFGYDDYVNSWLSPYGATLGPIVSMSYQGDTGIADVYNQICY